nr:MAG TPA: hypothetical protein [Caudoviricetes sp.]
MVLYDIKRYFAAKMRKSINFLIYHAYPFGLRCSMMALTLCQSN